MHIGQTHTWTRTFTEADVRLFGQVSGDLGSQHTQIDEQGRLMVHDLLTATLPTKIGGDLNFVAREITFEFVHPVYVGDTIQCIVIITNIEDTYQKTFIYADIICRNQQEKVVLRGHTSGVIYTLDYSQIGLH
ncbi:MAG TPA: enoyl-CoA hydratase [Dictyobacter sp.]|jgi:acyl dehydratase|nr:enoyl-CoA hydratase [Dictyobacter sp.]